MNADLITAEQFRMARAALAMSRADVAGMTGLSKEAVGVAETDPSRAPLALAQKLLRYYSAKGVHFAKDAGRIGVLLRTE
ncbi:MAG: hypothetical protein BGO81_20820 [Devosia sp. 66-22]|nr:MAG: hypothetical protein BGO81_20820 [Devosia sp. 66-22]